MEQEINQQPEQNPDETAAVLAFVTKLSEQLMPKPQENGDKSDLKKV